MEFLYCEKSHDATTPLWERANYLALHYWDNLDMSKQAMVENEATKQAFADFISILPHTDKEHRVLLKNTTPAKVEEYLSAR